jgi:hypothetical protein
MKPFRITIKNKGQSLNFDVMEYLHHEEGNANLKFTAMGK